MQEIKVGDKFKFTKQCLNSINLNNFSVDNQILDEYSIFEVIGFHDTYISFVEFSPLILHDITGTIISLAAIKDIIITNEQEAKDLCTCDNFSLFNRGCTCGYLKRNKNEFSY